MKLSPKAVLPMLVVAIGTLGGLGMIVARPTLSTQPPTRRLPLVRVMTAQTQALELAVEAQGSLQTSRYCVQEAGLLIPSTRSQRIKGP